ncbi:MAG: hypothetical protein QOF78_2461, partial [Phycisphaerales bacterium]|nr:hypothetical protein [Phycisphaerales bacterium]
MTVFVKIMMGARSAACGFALFLTSATLFAQNAPAQQPAVGLDALTDDKLITDLANRGLTKLLDRAYEVNNVPPQQRGAMQAVVGIKRLADPKLTIRQRDELIPQIVRGVEQALPGLTDPKTLNDNASDLLKYGVEREVSLLEYWGESARSQVPLRPTVEVVIKLLDKSADLAQKQADALANAIAGPNDPRAAKWEQLANVAAQAKYTRHMVDYYLALSMDRVASQQRKDVAAKAAEYLLQFDNADSNVQPQVRMQVAKLHMVRDDFAAAKDVFATIIDGKEIEPKPDVWQQWEARYFSAVSDLLRGDAAATQKGLNDLIAWQSGNLPKDKPSQDRAAAAASMLQYRIHALEADKAPTAEAKQKANAQAVAVLLDLVNKRPDLRSVIFRQLLAKLPPNVDLKTLDPLLLQGIVVRADEERLRPESDTIDAAVIQRGIDAAREVVRRRKGDSAAINAQTVDSDALLLG